MKGKHSGVQARLLDLNPKALYFPCVAHTLNLTTSDAVNCTTDTITFFGTITRLYKLFAAAPKRWQILKLHVPITLKSASDTRWESWVESVKPLRYHLVEIRSALVELEEFGVNNGHGEIASEARALREAICKWQFLLSVAIWYGILFQISNTSISLQSTKVTLQTQQSELAATIKFVKHYRETGYDAACIVGREMAEQFGDVAVGEFPAVRVRCKKRMFLYEAADEVDASPEQRFRSNFFLAIADRTLQSLKDRFSGLKELADVFGFLYESPTKTPELQNTGELLKHCSDFQTKMGDVDSDELEKEMSRFLVAKATNSASREALETPSEILDHLYKHHLFEAYPNFCIALRILLTLPVTVAAAERSFLKLTLIKTFHHSTMTDERLTGLALISIESQTARGLDLSELVDRFAKTKARKVAI